MTVLSVLKFLVSKPVLGGLAGLVLVVTLYLGYNHYKGLLENISGLETEKAVLETVLITERAAVEDLHTVVGDWETAQARLLVKLEEMQEIANESASEATELRQLFSEVSLSYIPVATADSLANAISDRLWGLIATATSPLSGSASTTDSTATP